MHLSLAHGKVYQCGHNRQQRCTLFLLNLSETSLTIPTTYLLYLVVCLLNANCSFIIVYCPQLLILFIQKSFPWKFQKRCSERILSDTTCNFVICKFCKMKIFCVLSFNSSFTFLPLFLPSSMKGTETHAFYLLHYIQNFVPIPSLMLLIACAFNIYKYQNIYNVLSTIKNQLF